MTVLIYPRTWGPYRTVQIVAHPITDGEATAICTSLAARDIPVHAQLDDQRAVHLWPDRDVTSREEARVLAAFIAVTDAPVRWHPWQPETVWGAA